MAKHNNIAFTPKHDKSAEKNNQKDTKVIHLNTQKDVADNLSAQQDHAKKTIAFYKEEMNKPGVSEKDKEKLGEAIETEKQFLSGMKDLGKEVKELNKEEQKLDQIEKEVDSTEKQIQAKKAKLIALDHEAEKAHEEVVEKHSKKEEKADKPAKKEKNRDRNLFNWARHIGTRAIAGVGLLKARAFAKVHHFFAKPQQIFSKELYKNARTNIKRIPKAIGTTISGALYKPHRGKEKFVDNFTDAGKTWGPDADDKNWFVRNGKKLTWFLGKPIKFGHNILRGVWHAPIELAESVRDAKWHWNPKNWDMKRLKFSKTKESFLKAFGWNRKGKKMDLNHLADKHEHKKAA